MYIGVHACIEVCMRASRCACVHRGVHACIEVCMRASRCACVHRGVHACIEVCMRASRCACVFDIHCSDRGSNPVVAVKSHNVYDYTIVQPPWQVSENHKLQFHPSHAREIGKSVRYLTKHKTEL